jgi:hypothetical protein
MSNDSRGLENFLILKMNKPDKNYYTNISKSLFTFNNEYILQIPDDPKERIFDPKIQENYLELKHLVMCDYSYIISSDLGKDLDRGKIFQVLLEKL